MEPPPLHRYTPPVKVFIHTLGCRVNQYESRLMQEALASLPGEGELHLVNTCTVTALADRKGRKLVRQLRREHPGAVVVAVGCQGEAAAGELLSAGADLVLGNRDKARIRERILAFLQGRTTKNTSWPPLAEERITAFPRSRALLKVQDGCNVGCSFCRTWLVRGPLRSKPPHVARQEAATLAQHHREIVLVGINLAQYGHDLPEQPSLVDLLQELLRVPGVRYRLTSLNPEGVTDELVDLFARESRLCPYFHLPLQSGDAGVLRAMGRPYTPEEYRERARRFLSRVPKATLGADVMVGFPGEDERAFERTLALLEELTPLNLHIFRFSPRPGTRAAKLPRQVPAQVKARRAAELARQATGWRQQAASRFLNSTLQVLLEQREDHRWLGHAENYLLVELTSSLGQRGTIVPVLVRQVVEGRGMGVIADSQEDL